MISNTRWSSKSRALTRIFGSFQDPDSSVQFIQDPESSSLMTMKRLKMMPVMMVRIRNYQVVVDSLGYVEDATIARHVYVCFWVRLWHAFGCLQELVSGIQTGFDLACYKRTFCKRTFSKLKLFKTRLRDTLSAYHLESLLLIMHGRKQTVS